MIADEGFQARLRRWLWPNGRALSRAATYSEMTLQPQPDAKMHTILWPHSGVGYSAVLGGLRQVEADKAAHLIASTFRTLK
jgi:hypothetical protein